MLAARPSPPTKRAAGGQGATEALEVSEVSREGGGGNGKGEREKVGVDLGKERRKGHKNKGRYCAI